MRITCVGGGPAGLYFAICAKRRDAGHRVTVLERDPAGTTYGWGVGYWDDLLDVLYRHDRESAGQVRAASALWRGREVRLGTRRTAYLGGYGYSINRSTLLDILARRAADLGVDIRHGSRVEESGFEDTVLEDTDLVVAADGARSRTRQRYGERFGTRTEVGRNRYLWLGTEQRFRRLTFAFESTPAGWVWFYGYPSAPGISTCVVECAPETWRGLALDRADEHADEHADDDGIRTLETVFERALGGHPLISRDRGGPARWSQFVEVQNARWHHDNVVLLGDAAHTVHFTMGSGTGLAMLDAAELATSLHRRAELPDALERYEQRRRAALRRKLAAGRTSMAWFERVDHYLGRDAGPDAAEVAFAMATRYQPERPWRYLAHQANQVAGAHRVREGYESAQRWYLARRRGEPIGRGARTTVARG